MAPQTPINNIGNCGKSGTPETMTDASCPARSIA
jgi:hypothetical protein